MSTWYMGSQEDLDFLQHYGVLGMKWGHRKSGGGISRKLGTAVAKQMVKSIKKDQQRIKKLSGKYQAKGMSKQQADKKASKRVIGARRAVSAGLMAYGLGGTAHLMYRAYKKDAGPMSFVSRKR